MRIPASQIRKGDRFSAPGYVVWTALADAVEVPDEGSDKPGMVVVEIQHHDGGRGTRAWGLGAVIEIVRDEPVIPQPAELPPRGPGVLPGGGDDG